MALVCDYCGDVTESAERESVAFGFSQEIALKGAVATEWFYYCKGECADAVMNTLTNLRLFAMHGEGAGLVWALTEQKVAPVAEDVKPVGDPPPAPGSDPDSATPKERQRVPLDKSPEVQERAGRLPLSWFLKREVSTPITELKARQEAGTPVYKVVTHTASKGALHNAGIVTLEDAAAMTEVEFAGLPGVGGKVLAQIKEGLERHALEFRAGPTLGQLGTVMRHRREGEGLDIEELIPSVLAELDAPSARSATDTGKSKAWWHTEAALKDCERGNKGLAPQILDVIAERLGTTRAGVLAEAMQVEG
jgi:hypothetical protein